MWIANCGKCKDNCVPPSKQNLDKSKGKRLCNTAERTIERTENNIRFQFLTTKELETLREGYIVPNTERDTQWSMRNLEAWKWHAQMRS